MFIQSLHPTKVDQQNYLNVLADSAGRLTIKVLNAQGHFARTYHTTVAAGMQQFPIDMEDLPTGKYVLNVFCSDKFLKSIRLIKQ